MGLICDAANKSELKSMGSTGFDERAISMAAKKEWKQYNGSTFSFVSKILILSVNYYNLILAAMAESYPCSIQFCQRPFNSHPDKSY
jgi:hypothetical protein